MTTTPLKTISLTVHEGGKKVMSLHNSELVNGLFYAAHVLTGIERLDLIEKIQAAHAELEARFR